MCPEVLGELGDGKDEHQVEEQLDIGDARMVAPGTIAQMADPGSDHGALRSAAQAAGSFGR